jgi:hypothetical protein
LAVLRDEGRRDRGTASADLRRGVIAEARVGPGLVVLPPVLLDHDPRLLRGVKPFAIQALVPETAVEALAHPVLPRLAGVDVGGGNAGPPEPLAYPPSDELRPLSLRRYPGGP